MLQDTKIKWCCHKVIFLPCFFAETNPRILFPFLCQNQPNEFLLQLRAEEGCRGSGIQGRAESGSPGGSTHWCSIKHVKSHRRLWGKTWNKVAEKKWTSGHRCMVKTMATCIELLLCWSECSALYLTDHFVTNVWALKTAYPVAAGDQTCWWGTVIDRGSEAPPPPYFFWIWFPVLWCILGMATTYLPTFHSDS